MKRLFFALILFFISTGPCLAASSVTGMSGAATDGSPLTFTGSGFVADASPAPLQWDNFDGGTHGSNISGAPVIGSNWSQSNSATGCEVEWSNAVTRAGSALSARADFTTASCYRSSLRRAFSPAIGSFYISLWYRSNYASMTAYNGVAPCRNQKIWRIEGDNGTLGGDQKEGVPLMAVERLSVSQSFTSLRADYTKADGLNSVYSTLTWRNGLWNRVEIYANVIDGQKDYQIFENFVDRTSSKTGDWWTDTFLPLMGDGGSRFNEFFCGFYFSRDGGAAAYVYFDDLYMSTKRARVEIGNSPTWATCTLREIQPTTSRADGSVTVTFNQGALENGQTVYAYVVPPDGAVNANGYAFTVGGGSPDTCENDVTLCASEADCSTYWPAYHWCDGVCQSEACPAAETCAENPILCATEADCSTYWPAYNWCSGYSCRSAACLSFTRRALTTGGKRIKVGTSELRIQAE